MLCPKCSRAISLDYGQDKCPHCNEHVGTGTVIKKVPEGLHPPSSEPSSPSVTITEDPDRPPTWDDEGPFFSRLWNTFVATMFHPSTFFSQTPTDAGIGRPLLYALIVGTIGMISIIAWEVIFIATSMLPTLPQSPENAVMIPYLSVSLIFWLIATPISVVMGTFISSAILHLSLMIIKGNEQGFEATFRSITYSMSTNLLSLVPICGWIAGPIWQIVLLIIGLKETHGISTGKAIVALLLPVIFGCGCCIGLFAFGMMGILSNSFNGPPPSYPY